MLQSADTANSVVDRIVNFTPCAAPRRSYFAPPARRRQLTAEEDIWDAIKDTRKEIQSQLRIDANRADAYVNSEADLYNMFYNDWRRYITDPANIAADPVASLILVSKSYLNENAPIFDNTTIAIYAGSLALMSGNGAYDSIYGPDWAT